MINEIFQSIQGEGLYQGKNVLFIRFNKCNLSCNLCDTKYTWNGKNNFTIAEAKEEIKKHDHIVITGGEPLMFQEEIIDLISSDKEKRKFFEIETNGTILLENPSRFLQGDKILFNVSPKGNIERCDKLNAHPILLEQISQRDIGFDYIAKFLLGEEMDFKYIDKIVQHYNIETYKVYIQPIGETVSKISETLEKFNSKIIEKGWSISYRLHIIFNLK